MGFNPFFGGGYGYPTEEEILSYIKDNVISKESVWSSDKTNSEIQKNYELDSEQEEKINRNKEKIDDFVNGGENVVVDDEFISDLFK